MVIFTSFLFIGIALSEVVSYIEETIHSSDATAVPVFRLQDLKALYQKQMQLNGASIEDIERVHVTRFKLRLLEEVPGLCESKSGRNVLLTIDSEIGMALFEACRSTSQDDNLIIASK